MTAIRVEVTAEQIAAAGDDRMAWAAPVEEAIAALCGGVGVSIDGDGDQGSIATIGTQEEATLVVDLPPSINAWLDARWALPGEVGGYERGEPIAFDIDVPWWLAALVGPADLVTLTEASRVLGTITAQSLRSAAAQRREGMASETALAARLGMRRIGRDWFIPRHRLDAEVARRREAVG